jgi:mannose-6-phosphate isomerase-like protein (cupin superfamily)
MTDYTVVKRQDAQDAMTKYPGFGEMRMFTGGLGAEQTAFTWRSMPADTGGRGSYGHRHRSQEEIYFVISGNLTFKLEDEIFEAGPGTAVRIAPHVVRSVHNDGPDEVELVICSPTVPGGSDSDAELVEDFWPAD